MSDSKKDISKEMQDRLKEVDRFAEISKLLKGQETKKETKKIIDKHQDDLIDIDIEDTKFDPFEDSNMFLGLNSVENENDYTLNTDEFDDVYDDFELEDIESINDKQVEKDDDLNDKFDVLVNDVNKLQIIVDAMQTGTEIGFDNISNDVLKNQKLILNELKYLEKRISVLEQKDFQKDELKDDSKIQKIFEPEQTMETPFENDEVLDSNNEEKEQTTFENDQDDSTGKNIHHNYTDLYDEADEALKSNKGSESPWQNVKKTVKNVQKQETVQNAQNVQKQDVHVLNSTNPKFSYLEEVLINDEPYVVVGETTDEDGHYYIVEDETTGKTLVLEPNKITKK